MLGPTSWAERHAKTNFSSRRRAAPGGDRTEGRGTRVCGAGGDGSESLAGALRVPGAAKEAGVKLLVGAEVTPADASPAVLRVPTAARAYH